MIVSTFLSVDIGEILYPPAGYEPKFGVYLLVTIVSTFFCLTITAITILLYFTNNKFKNIIQVLRLHVLKERGHELRSGAIFVEIGWILLEISFIKVGQQKLLTTATTASHFENALSDHSLAIDFLDLPTPQKFLFLKSREPGHYTPLVSVSTP